MTNWVTEDCPPDSYELGYDCVLVDRDQKSTQVTLKQYDLLLMK